MSTHFPDESAMSPVPERRSPVEQAAPDEEYLLGHEDPEIARLEHQARMLAPATSAILSLAGLRPGMRVLDLGTGPGDVAFAAAQLVGTTGTVVGLDQEARVLDLARRRAAARGLDNITFVEGDARTWQDGQPFDAVVGRLVLLYCPDPAAVVRHHCASLVSGGVYVAMEYDMPAARADPPCPTVALAAGWLVEGFQRGGLDPALGLRLGPVLEAGGLSGATVLGMHTYLDAEEGARMLSGIIATLLPLITRTGIATADEVDIGTLEDRIRAELSAAASILSPPTLVGAWARTAS